MPNATTTEETQPLASDADATSAKPLNLRDGTELQQLIDSAADVVTLPAGIYVMRDSLRLRSGQRVLGNGAVILHRADVVESPLVQIAGFGHREICVEHADRFPVGTGIAITQNPGGGFGTTIARVIGRRGNALFLDTPVGKDFRPVNEARARSIFPMIAGYNIQHAEVSGIRIRGDDTAAQLDGCRDAGVYLIGCRDVRLTDIEVSLYAGDAISFQQCVDTYVDHCHLHHNAGHGLHPGSGSVRYVMHANHIHDNRNCGIFYCLRTTHSTCTQNRIERNEAEGISIGERDTDHLIESNTLRDNAAEGIRFRQPVCTGGDRVVVRGNTFAGNGVLGKVPQLTINAGTHSVLLSHNTFSPASVSSPLIDIGEGCRDIAAIGNTLGERASNVREIESASPINGSPDESSWRVGPLAIDDAGAMHLSIASLGKWIDRTE